MNSYFLLGLIFARGGPGFFKIRHFAFALTVIFLIINFKGLQGMPIFAIALYVYAVESHRKQRSGPIVRSGELSNERSGEKEVRGERRYWAQMASSVPNLFNTLLSKVFR